MSSLSPLLQMEEPQLQDQAVTIKTEPVWDVESSSEIQVCSKTVYQGTQQRFVNQAACTQRRQNENNEQQARD